jgi:hypothetical protein
MPTLIGNFREELVAFDRLRADTRDYLEDFAYPERWQILLAVSSCQRQAIQKKEEVSLATKATLRGPICTPSRLARSRLMGCAR